MNIDLRASANLRFGAARFALALGILAAPLSAHADETAPAADNFEEGAEIVVSARHRNEDAQDVPIALSVVSAEALEKTGNFTLGQVQQLVPSLQVFSFNPRNTNINIRGLGSNVALTNDGLENGVGVYIDGVFYGRVGQTQFDLVDLQQVEVLRGPQGTLFGKNTTAGAINITSRLPSFEPEFSGEATLGNYNYRQFRASVSAPISDKIAFRLSGADTRRDGFLDNVRTRREVHDYENTNVRGQLLIKPSDPLTIRLIGDYARQKQECCVNVLVGAFTTFDNGTPVPNNILQRFARAGYTPQPFTPFARQTDVDSPFHANMEAYGFSGQINYELAGAALTSITASRHWLWNPANDVDSVGLPVVTLGQQANRQKQFSQELRLASTGTRRLDYVVGLYYFYQIVKGYGASAYGAAAPDWFRGATNALPLATWNAALNGFKATSYSSPETRSYAAFGQTTWHISGALSLTTGLRYTHEDKSGEYRQDQVAGLNISAFPGAQAIRNNFNPTLAFSTKRSDDSISGTASLAYKITPQTLAYASYSRGNKSGGLNLTAIPTGIDPSVRPEKVNAYEVGLKSQFLDRTVTLNLAAFWTDVSDYQSAITEQIPSTVTYRQYIANIGKARSKGAEVDLFWQPTRWVGLTASANYTDAKYRNYVNGQAPVESGLSAVDLSGEPLSGVPKFTYALGGDVAQPIRTFELYAHADFSHRSGYYTATSNSRYSLVPGYGLLNARLGVRTGSGTIDVSIWARNLLNKDYFQTLTPANTGLVTGLVGDPRTFGVTVRTKL